MIKNAHIGYVARTRRPLLSALIVVLFASGCASTSTNNRTQTRRDRNDKQITSQQTNQNAPPRAIWGRSDSYSRNNPSLLFPSDSLVSLYNDYDGDLSYIFDYGIFARNDKLLGVIDESQNVVVFSDAVVTNDETLYESNGRTFVYGRRRVQSTQVRRNR